VLVLDCSVAVAWCFEDEASRALDALLDQVRADGAVVPALWVTEIGNVLVQAALRGRLPPEAVQERLGLFDMLPIEVDAAGQGPAWRAAVLALAVAEALSAYNAAYLELAIRRRLPLASGDATLRRAALRHGVPVLPG
jgi:predicted nucleic acid-binding protein